MRETFDPWPFVAAAYVIGVAAVAALVVWALVSMRRAERRRDEIRARGRDA